MPYQQDAQEHGMTRPGHLTQAGYPKEYSIPYGIVLNSLTWGSGYSARSKPVLREHLGMGWQMVNHVVNHLFSIYMYIIINIVCISFSVLLSFLYLNPQFFLILLPHVIVRSE